MFSNAASLLCSILWILGASDSSRSKLPQYRHTSTLGFLCLWFSLASLFVVSYAFLLFYSFSYFGTFSSNFLRKGYVGCKVFLTLEV